MASARIAPPFTIPRPTPAMPRSTRQPPDDARLAALSQAVAELSQHVQALYETIDAFRLDFAGLLERHAPPTPMVVTSFPRDPTAADWNERLNRYSVAADEFDDEFADEFKNEFADEFDHEFDTDTTEDITQRPEPPERQRRLWTEEPEK